MLQRAASNAYSWWWASHIRKKQSTWLEQSLQDMEDKVKYTLKLLEEDGDSFAKRAEMYYKKRPELIEFVEEAHREYRALADRYDHISGELQNANHTIATVFPEQFQYAADEEDEDNPPEISGCSPDPGKLGKELPEVPSMPKFSQLSKKNTKGPPTLPTKKPPTKKTTTSTSSSNNKSKAKALEEIDKLQKEILGLQTEKEFVKSSYESVLARYWEIEERITEMQEQVCSLQDEFNVSTVIQDDDARALMATTALKSCKETLDLLQEKLEMLAKEARVENQKIKNAHEKLENLKGEFTNNQNVKQAISAKDESIAVKQTLKTVEHETGNLKQGRFELESIGKKSRGQFETRSAVSPTVIELAEKIDKLVTKVTGMDATVLAQTALIKRLRSETDKLQGKLKLLEEEKATLFKGSDHLNNKLKELEKELHGIQGLDRNITDQHNHLQTDFVEAHCSLDYLSKNLQCVKQPPDEEVENMSSFQAPVKVPFTGNLHNEPKGQGDRVQLIDPMSKKDSITKKEEQSLSISVEGVDGVPQPKGHLDLDIHSERTQRLKHQNAVQEHNSSKMENKAPNVKQQELANDKNDQPNWQSLFLNGLEDKEKILMEKYTSVLQKYKEAKKELSEVQTTNNDSLCEIMIQVMELKGANALKDEEIQSLRQKVSFLQTSCVANSATHSRVHEDSEKSRPGDGKIKRPTSQFSDILKQISDLSEERHVETTSRADESSLTSTAEAFTKEEEIKLAYVDKPHTVSAMEEKFRRDIDELLEQNLEFWMRFSSSFQQIQMFQTAVQDLKAEYSKLKRDKCQQDSKTTATDQSQKSDARPIYKHLREIQTELTVWLEQNAVLKDELQDRFSSLGNIQEELSRVSNAGSKTEDTNLTRYQAAKFQGEIQNMRQENNKVSDELQAGLDHVRGIQSEIEKTLSKLNEDFKLSESKSPLHNLNHSPSRNKIPLQSFIFGTKTKRQKPKIFLAMHPALHKQKQFQVHR